MARIIKWHYQPDGAWQLMYAEYCGTYGETGLMTTNHVESVTCLKCLERMTRPVIVIKAKVLYVHSSSCTK